MHRNGLLKTKLLAAQLIMAIEDRSNESRLNRVVLRLTPSLPDMQQQAQAQKTAHLQPECQQQV